MIRTSGIGNHTGRLCASLRTLTNRVKDASPYFTCPVDDYFISSRFGLRGSRHHNGVDLAAEEGSPIRAAAEGKVVRVGYDDSGFGNYIEIEHKRGWRTLYAHAKHTHKRIGDSVKRREVIAQVGSTGRSTGPHVHFEVRNPQDMPRDPEDFVVLQRESKRDL